MTLLSRFYGASCLPLFVERLQYLSKQIVHVVLRIRFSARSSPTVLGFMIYEGIGLLSAPMLPLTPCRPRSVLM